MIQVFRQHKTFLGISSYNPMNNIYYLRNQNSWQRTNIPQARRSNSELRRASPSSRKTEPKYSHNIKHILRQHHNTIQGISQSSKSKREMRKEQACSSIDRNPTIIHFRRVQQPPCLQKRRMANNGQDVSKGRKVQSKCESRTIGRQVSQHKETLMEIEEDSISTLQGLYSLQPKHKLFLCQHCIAYLPLIEIKSHFAHCIAPKSHQQYLEQWKKIAQLLQEINQMQPSSQLYKLAALMLAYDQSQHKESNDLLYSEELSRILAYESTLSTDYLNGQQLFNVLEKLGDKLQTIIKQSQPWCS